MGCAARTLSHRAQRAHLHNNVHTKLEDNAEVHIRIRSFQAEELNARAHRARVVPKNTNPPRDCATLNNVHTKLVDNAEVHIRIRSFQAGARPRATQPYPVPMKLGLTPSRGVIYYPQPRGYLPFIT